MRTIVAIMVFTAVLLMVAVVATVITKSVGGGPSMSFLLGMCGGPLALFSGLAVYVSGER